jgi:hypothetical protein
VCNLSDIDVGIGKQCARDVKVILRQLRRSPACPARAPRGGEARLGGSRIKLRSNSGIRYGK